MAYPNFDGVVKSVETCARNSPIIQGVGVFGLTHDYGDIAAGCVLDFTLGHFQQMTLSQHATITLLSPPGTFDMLLKIATNSESITWAPLLMCPAGTPDDLLSLPLIFDAVDVVHLHYAKDANSANYCWWATSFAKNVNMAPVSIAVTTIDNPVDIGAFSQCTATATYSDATVKDITRSCVWVSSDPTKIAMDITIGQVEGVAAGPANITATLGTISGVLAMTCH
jgi:hypothetical protein